MQIDPRAMRLFLAICKSGSISGAARSANISQPSVSVAIGQLERKLATKLFDRHRSGIRLTPSGIALRRRAEAMENILEAAEREIHLINTDVMGPLVVGGTPGALASLIPKVIASMQMEYPRFEVRILEKTDEAVLDLLKSHHIDIGVVTAGIDDRGEEFIELPLFQDPFSLIVGRNNAHLPQEISLTALTDAHWVLPDAVGGFRRQVDALFVNADVPMPQNIIRCDSLMTTKAIVRRTEYMTILPREVAAAEVSTGVLRSIPIKEAHIRRRVGLIWLKDRQPTFLTEAFVEHARRHKVI